MTRTEILKLYPNASESTIRANLDTFGQGYESNLRNQTLKSEMADSSFGVCRNSPGRITSNEIPKNRPKRVRAVQSQSDERLSLEHTPAGEEACWHDAATRFEIVFIVYAVRPCDWDGYDIKALQDFCVKTGAIPNDGWETLSGRVVSRKAATQGEEKTEIEITAIQ